MAWKFNPFTGNLDYYEADTAGSTLPVVDTTAIVKGSVDDTKQMRFEVDGITTATTRVITVPDDNGTMELKEHFANNFLLMGA